MSELQDMKKELEMNEKILSILKDCWKGEMKHPKAREKI